VADIKEGHNLLLLAMRVPQADTREEIEKDAVEWLADALGTDASRRSREGEFVVGPANPVTVIPVPTATVLERERDFCSREDAERVLTSGLPLIPAEEGRIVIPVLVHFDWSGGAVSIPDAWEKGVFSWSADDVDAPALTIRGTCFTSARARDAIEPPTFVGEIGEDLAELGERAGEAAARVFNKKVAFTVGGVALGSVALWALWRSTRK
jgi:hypothetical protein